MKKPRCTTSEKDSAAYKPPRFVGVFQTPGANVPAYTRVSISTEMKEWVEATDLKFEHLYQQINLLQEQVQKSSLGFPSAISSNTYRAELDSAAENSSSEVEINPNPPSLCAEPVSDSRFSNIDVDDLVTLLTNCDSLLANMVLYPVAPYNYGHVADVRSHIKDTIKALTYVWEPYTQHDDK